MTFLLGYNGIFNVRIKNNNFYFSKSKTDKSGFIQSTIRPGAQPEKVKEETKRNIIKKGQFSEADYPFPIKPKFWTLGSNIRISIQELIVGFVQDDSIKNLLNFSVVIYEQYNLSHESVDILSFDNISLHCKVPQGMIFKKEGSRTIQNLTTDVTIPVKTKL